VVFGRAAPGGGRRFCLLTRGLEVFSLRLMMPRGALGGCAELEGCAVELDGPVAGGAGGGGASIVMREMRDGVEDGSEGRER
jgi:hypothetical protein